MGNLFSSEPSAEEIRIERERRENEARLLEQRRQQELRRQEELRQQNELRRLEQLRIEQQRIRELEERLRKEEERIRSLPEAKVIVEKSILFKATSLHDLTTNWTTLRSNIDTVRYFLLDQSTFEYKKVERQFRETTKRHVKISEIERVENKYLLQAYLLKKEELRHKYCKTPKEEWYFHGTDSRNVDNICKYNFDWRKKGVNKGHIFGQGVSFTPISYYATYYGDQYSNKRVMILALVLECNRTTGNQFTTLPPNGYDTTAKPNGHVIVKYEDNEFYPAYKITYCIN